LVLAVLVRLLLVMVQVVHLVQILSLVLSHQRVVGLAQGE
jgi:hypothetical protein